MMQYSINAVTQFVREIGRSPGRLFHEVPVNFCGVEILVSAEREPKAVVITLSEIPDIPFEKFMEFVNGTFSRLSGRLVTIRIKGCEDLNAFAEENLHLINESWMTYYFSASTQIFTLEIYRCVPR